MTMMSHFALKLAIFPEISHVSSMGASQVVLVVRSSPGHAGDLRDAGLIHGSGRSPGGGQGNPLQFSCLENPMDRGAWGATVHGVTELDTTKQVSTHAHLSVQDKGCTLIAHVTNTVPR